MQNIRNIIIFAYKYYEISVLIIRQGIIFVNIGVIIIKNVLNEAFPVLFSTGQYFAQRYESLNEKKRR